PLAILTRTEMTAGFTFSTRSANPIGRSAPWAYATALSGAPGWGRIPALPSSTVTPRPATPASKTRRRAERVRDFGAETLAVITVTPSLVRRGPRGTRCRARWGTLPYRALSEKLNFGKVGKVKKAVDSQRPVRPRLIAR